MALARVAFPRGRVSRFLDFWRFSAVFCPDIAGPLSTPAARCPLARDARAVKIFKRADARATVFFKRAPP